MKKITLLLLLVTLAFSTARAETKPFAEPILLTSCGQSADALMMKVLLGKDSLAFEYLPSASAADLAGRGSLLIVLGGSSKGLGAAKISAEDETARVTALLEAARQAELPVLAVHLGGKDRRGALSDPFNRLGAEHAQRLIVVKGGNEDGFFTTIGEEKSIPMDTVASGMSVSPVLRAIYRGE